MEVLGYVAQKFSIPLKLGYLLQTEYLLEPIVASQSLHYCVSDFYKIICKFTISFIFSLSSTCQVHQVYIIMFQTFTKHLQ